MGNILFYFVKKMVWFFWIMSVLAGLTGCGHREAVFFQDELQEENESEKAAKSAASEETLTGEAQTAEKNDAKITPIPEKIYVDVCGAVAHPGVYELDADSRVFQAVELAGGYTAEAAENYLNGARILEDGQQIYVPTGEELDAQTADGENAQMQTAPEAGSPTGSREEQDDGLIDLNTAAEEELMTLTGIGASKAKAIIAYREKNGGFSSIEELMEVDGIKEGTFQKIKDKIAVK